MLAQKKKLAFYDLDNEITKAGGKTIPEIFSENGEAYFRELESKTLQTFFNDKKTEDYVLGLGGGTPCFFDNLDSIKQNGILFFLDVPLEIIVKRLQAAEQSRPLLQQNAEETLKKLLELRLPFYMQADFTVDASRHIPDVVHQVEKKTGIS